MADIVQIAEKLNAEVNRLNTERSKLEGKTESARTQYEKAVKAYEAKYGVKLTPENLQSIYNEVYARKLGLAEDLQAKITSINNGDYKKDTEVKEEFNLTPDVAPIHMEDKKKKKTKKEDKVVKEDLEELLASADSVLESKTPSEVVPVAKEEIHKVEEDVIAPPVVEKKGRKPLTGADISAALKQAENIVQHPVTAIDETSDEVDLNSLNFDMGVETPKVDAKESVKSEDEIDLNGFNFDEMPVSEQVADSVSINSNEPSFGENPNVSEDEVPFDMGDFGGFGDMKIEETPSDKIKESKDNLDSFTFGGLGDLVPDAVDSSKEKSIKDTPVIEDADWGADLSNLNFDFNAIGGILDPDKDVKFG